MTRRVQFGTSILERSLRYALSREASRKSFHAAFRFGIRASLKELLIEAGVASGLKMPLPRSFRPTRPAVALQPLVVEDQMIDAEFCLRYGFGDGSVTALNYLYRSPAQNSVLPFLESDSFSIGNFLFRLDLGENELALGFEDGVTAVGYMIEIEPCSQHSLLAILGLRFHRDTIRRIVDALPESSYLDALSPCSAPPLWIDRRSGQRFTCTCFSSLLEKGRSQQTAERVQSKLGCISEVQTRPGLCSICSNHVPPPEAGHPMYYNAFLQRYLPYRDLFYRKMFDGIKLASSGLKEAERIAEQAARLAVGYPTIGQKWIEETTLYQTVRSLLAPRLVVQHYQGKELRGQEIDIWVPSLKLAIEYHGPQHFRAIAAWGGEDALLCTKERDRRKRQLVTELGYSLVEFHHDEQFTEETVMERIQPYVPVPGRGKPTSPSCSRGRSEVPK
jgi:hypothetical protein